MRTAATSTWLPEALRSTRAESIRWRSTSTACCDRRVPGSISERSSTRRPESAHDDVPLAELGRELRRHTRDDVHDGVGIVAGLDRHEKLDDVLAHLEAENVRGFAELA